MNYAFFKAVRIFHFYPFYARFDHFIQK